MKASKFERKFKFSSKKNKTSEADFYLSNPNRVKKKIRVARQSITIDKKNLPVSSKGLTMPELINKLNHPVIATKQKALAGILQLSKRISKDHCYNIGAIAHSTWPLRWNEDQKIRHTADDILKSVLKLTDGSVWFHKLAVIYLTEGYSNPYSHIVRDALEFTEYLIKRTPKILNSMSTQLTTLIIKINSPENTLLQCHLLYEITRTHPYKHSSFLYSESIETLIYNANSINHLHFYRRTLELALDAFDHAAYAGNNDNVIKQLKTLLECAILIKESISSCNDLIEIAKCYPFPAILPNIAQLNAKNRRSADELISHLLVIKWQIQLLIDKKPNFRITQAESESMYKVIGAKFTIPLPGSISALINYALALDNIEDFEIVYYKTKQTNVDNCPRVDARDGVSQVSDTGVDTFGCLIELVIFAIKQNLPALLIRQVLSKIFNDDIMINWMPSNCKISRNTSSGNVLKDMKDTFRIHTANLT
ncbi:hypothetical protein BMR1_03g02430 [Babesia microti strain RI]|uniref:Uncharacterized protein n=1 Tax=Babesia microti (strain RI) TaxID=1133968 RepID=A0A0K3AU28_BABMR|nr:hypothetical protein BMR1_03g02430 [Babesia microti strain RI]CTQ41086.1 hypothetical protein BMR1_03g02430 [Babesia microti strain RI]|eukprot:XP_012649097.1 hypothetical protein BMR1_03g02430 [Babesia microti strain RI]